METGTEKIELIEYLIVGEIKLLYFEKNSPKIFTLHHLQP